MFARASLKLADFRTPAARSVFWDFQRLDSLKNSSCSNSLMSSPWICPLSDPPWTLFVVLSQSFHLSGLPAFLSVPFHHPFSIPCVRLLCPPLSLPLSPWHEVAPSGRGAICHTPMDFCSVFITHVLCALHLIVSFGSGVSG